MSSLSMRCHQAATPGIYSRGNPDGPTLDGKEIERVHFHIPAKRPGVTRDYPICLNGAFNLRWTDDDRKVTCEACKALMTPSLR